MKTPVSLIHCQSYTPGEVQSAVRRAAGLLGGMGKFVKPGERILLKPNLIGAREPERGVTTHPEVVRAVIRLVKEAGAVPVVGDSPGGAIKGVDRVWEKTGMKNMAAEENVELINFETSGSKEKTVTHPKVSSVHIANAVLDVDGIINLPKLKTHTLTIFTGAVKNFYGCVPGLRKAEYHKLAPHPDEFARLIAEIYMLVKDKVRLNIMDGVVGMEGNGPNSGDMRKLDMVLACTDGLALDTAVTYMLGHKPEKIETINYLTRKKAGESDIRNIEITGDELSRFNVKDFRFPSNWYMNLIPHFLINIIGKHIWLKPMIIPDLCTSCLLCVNSCPVKAIEKKGKDKPVVHPEKCISCLCCHELCDYKAIELKSSKLSKLLIRQ